jgi:hypothetical protein
MSTMLSAGMARAYRAAESQPNPRSGIATAVACVLSFGALLGAGQPASAQFTQQGAKLVGTGAVGVAGQGFSVRLSADGSTAILGGPEDNSNTGAAWEFTQSDGVWSQQGTKAVGTGAIGGATQGYAVALSTDGNTAIVGGPTDNSNAGAAWAFTLTGNVKLPIGNGAVGHSQQGQSVALSADGNTAIVGGPADASDGGAAWVFTQFAGVWTQQGSKLVGNGGAGTSSQGWSVALSADGNTAMVGGYQDNSFIGAAWFFTRSSGVWSQQGSKQFGSGAVGDAEQGWSAALSADGNTAIVGGPSDNSHAGAAWIFVRAGNGSWSQQGSKLVGNGAVGAANQGWSVGLSADGNTAIVGGPFDNSNAGAAWVFTRSNGVWTQQGSKLNGSGAAGAAQQGFAVALSADGTTAIVGGSSDLSDAGAAWIFTSPAHLSGLLSAAPTSGHAPLPVTFRAIGLSLPMTYTINFGDDTVGPLNQGNCFGTQSGFRCTGVASHTYAATGSYTATLLNALGLSLATVTISVNGNVATPLPGHHPIRTIPPILAARPATPSPTTPEQHSLVR